jgi:hypothetical protein
MKRKRKDERKAYLPTRGRERPEETGRGTSGKSRQSIKILTLLETH